MVSRLSARLLAATYVRYFRRIRYIAGDYIDYTATNALYDFLFDNDCDAWLLNKAKLVRHPRQLQELIMGLHTGETQYEVTQSWTHDQRSELGQALLKALAVAILNVSDERQRQSLDPQLLPSLELDGYMYRDGRLLPSEADTLDAAEEQSVLKILMTCLALPNRNVAENHLDLSAEHYIAGRWGDCIANSRSFLESVLREVATAYSHGRGKTPIGRALYENAERVMDFLEKESLLEPREKRVVSSVYVLLSNTGSHPNMAENDQARLLRHLSLTLAQFVMLRLRGMSTSNG